MWHRFDMRDFASSASASAYMDSARGWYRRVQGRPTWVWQAAIVAAVVVFAIPVVLLVLAALLAAAVVFTVLSLVLGGLGVLRRLFSGGGANWPTGPVQDDGRRNVRVRMPGAGPGRRF